jgi:hypothetical protein
MVYEQMEPGYVLFDPQIDSDVIPRVSSIMLVWLPLLFKLTP